LADIVSGVMMTMKTKGRGPFVSTIMLTVLLVLLSLLSFIPSVPAEQLISETYPNDDIFIMEGEAVVFTVALQPDVDLNDTIVQWYKDGNPVVGDGLSYRFQSGFEDNGTYKVTVFVVSNATTESHDWALTVMEVKEKFSISSWVPKEDVAITEGKEEYFFIEVDNPAEDNLTYRWFVDYEYQLGNDLSFFRYMPDLGSQGEHRIRVVIESIDNVEEHEWKVVVEDALEVTPIGDVDLQEGGTLDFTVRAPELLDSEVTWYLDDSTGSVATGRTYSFAPDHGSAGTHILTMNTTRGLGYQWIIQVEDVNRPPSVENGKVVRATKGEAAKLNGVATDPDNDIVLYEWDFDGDGTFDHTSQNDGRTTYAYSRTGTYLATFRVTDSHGETATTTFQCTVTDPVSLSGWHYGAILLAILVLLVLVWIVRDISRERKARARAKELERLARLDKVKEPIRDDEVEELPVFEDIEEVEEEEEEPEFDMVPYAMKMADREMDAEGDADETEISVGEVEVRPKVREKPEEEVEEDEADKEREELDALLMGLAAKAEKEKADLRSKRASAEVGAEDTDIHIGPSHDRARKHKKKKKKKKVVEEKARASMGAEADLEAGDDTDDLDVVMQSLVDKGLAERRAKPKKKKRKKR
jgi:PKD repeat protein